MIGGFFIRAKTKAVSRLETEKLHGSLDVWRFKLPFLPSLVTDGRGRRRPGQKIAQKPTLPFPRKNPLSLLTEAVNFVIDFNYEFSCGVRREGITRDRRRGI